MFYRFLFISGLLLLIAGLPLWTSEIETVEVLDTEILNIRDVVYVTSDVEGHYVATVVLLEDGSKLYYDGVREIPTGTVKLYTSKQSKLMKAEKISEAIE